MSLERKLSSVLNFKNEEDVAGYISTLNEAIEKFLEKKYYLADTKATLAYVTNPYTPALLMGTKITAEEVHKHLNASKSGSYPSHPQLQEICNHSSYFSVLKDGNDPHPVLVQRSILFGRDRRNNLLLEDRIQVKGESPFAQQVFSQIDILYTSLLTGQQLLPTDTNKKEKKPLVFLPPKEIHKRLDEYVMGQSTAKKGLAVAISNHYAKILNNSTNVEKNNILLMGPTGCGKTLLAKTIAKIVDVPFVIVEAPEYTSEGYVGKKADEIFYELVKAAHFDFERAEKGIVYIDEIDKVKETFGNGPDVNGGGVQDALLRKMEGSEIELPTTNVDMRDVRQGKATVQKKKFRTDNVLFIFGGAFTELDKIRATYDASHVSVGFNAARDQKKPLYVDMLHQYGMKREFLGRIPTILKLDKLTIEEMVDILQKPKDALLGQYQQICKNQSIEVDITGEGLRRIAEEADRLSLGARSLRTVLDMVVNPIIYENSGSNQKVTIDKDTIEKYLSA